MEPSPIPANIAMRIGDVLALKNANTYETEQRERERPERIRRYWRESHVPALHAEKIDFPAAKLREPIAHAGWQKNWEIIREPLGTGALLICLGRRGTGKTQASALAAAVTCAADRSCRYVTAARFFVAIKSTYRREADKTEDDVLNEFARPSLLVVDEAHERSESAWETRLLTTLCDERYGAGKDTILLGNQTSAEMSAALGSSIVDRARENGGIVLYDWQSFRGA